MTQIKQLEIKTQTFRLTHMGDFYISWFVQWNIIRKYKRVFDVEFNVNDIHHNDSL